MDYYQCFVPNGYNICKFAGNTRGYHHTDEDKKKMSFIAKERFRMYPEFIKYGKDNPAYGKHPSQETRDKMSESRKGNQNAKGATWSMKQETKDKISAALKGKQNCLGRKLSQETKDKISESNRSRKITEKTKAKMSKSHKGKTTKRVLCVEPNFVYDSIGEASESVKIDRSGIGKCCQGRQKTCGGYHWKYVNE